METLTPVHMRVHIAAHHTLEQSAMDKKIIPLSFLECFLLLPPISPPPLSENTGSFLQSVTVPDPDVPTSCGSRYINTVQFFSTPVNLSPERAGLGPSLESRSSLGLSGPENNAASKSNSAHLNKSAIYLLKHTRKWPQFSSQALTLGRAQTFSILLRLHKAGAEN